MKGILFRPELIKAIVDGRKIETRRVIKPQPIITRQFADYKNITTLIENLGEYARYSVGEVVYIKEAHRYIQNDGNPYDFGIQYLDSQVKWWRDNGNLMDYPIDEKWRSPLFLKEIFARYFIKIAGVRAEWMQEVTWYDIPKEGIQDDTWSIGKNRFIKKTPKRLISDFKHLWDSINKDCPFESNPYVFRYEFGLTSVGAMK